MAHDKKGKDFVGPSTWEVLHSFAASYDASPQSAKAFKDLVYSLTMLFPCEVCRENLKAKLKKYPIDPYLTSNNSAFLYTYILHDDVNKHLGKTSPKYDDVKKYYFDKMGQVCDTCRVHKN